MLVNRLKYSREDLIKVIIQFKADHRGKLPETHDWEKGKITPSLRTFQRRLKSIEEAILEADQYNSVGEYENKLLEDEQKREKEKYKRRSRKEKCTSGNTEEIMKPKKRKSTARDHSGFQCPFCGNWTTGIEAYYSSLTNNLIHRFVNLIDSDHEGGYFEGVMDCIFQVFRSENLAVRKVLAKAGYLERYDQRIKKKEELETAEEDEQPEDRRTDEGN